MSEYNLKSSKAGINASYDLESRIKKHQMRLYFVGIIVILGSLGVFGYKQYMESKNDSAQEEIFDAVFAFERGEYENAIKGTEDFGGLEEAARKYRSGKIAKLINFYLGISYLNTKKYNEAIKCLEVAVDIDDRILAAQACGLIGDCYAELDNKDKAIEFFNKAANMNASNETSPIYLVKIATAYEASGDIDKALEMYEYINKNYRNYRSDFIEKNIYRLKG